MSLHLDTIIVIASQPVFAHISYEPSGDTANTNIIVFGLTISGADPGFQVRGGTFRKIASSGGSRENFWGISCEKSRFCAKKKNHIFSDFRGGRSVYDMEVHIFNVSTLTPFIHQ